MVDVNVWITDVALPEHLHVHLRQVLSPDDLQRELLVLFLNTSWHPWLVFNSIRIGSHFKLDCIITWPLYCNGHCDGRCDLSLVFCIRIGECNWLVVDDVELLVIDLAFKAVKTGSCH